MKRIQLIDGLRGLAVCLMVLHHLAYDLVEFMGAPAWLFSCPPIDFLHYVFAGLFVLLCGVCSNFSRSNLKRGLKTAAVAAVITAVTCWLHMDILWGVLHLLAFCMLVQGLGDWLAELCERSRRPRLTTALVAAGVCALILALPFLLRQGRSSGSEAARVADFILGIHPEYFASADYFPLLPWFFVFEAGTLLGKPIREEKFPKWFYEAKMPFFSTVGRHSLLIYVLHQHILYGAVMAILAIRGT